MLVGELYLLTFDLCVRAAPFSPCCGLTDPRSVILKNKVPGFRSGWESLIVACFGMCNYCSVGISNYCPS